MTYPEKTSLTKGAFERPERSGYRLVPRRGSSAANCGEAVLIDPVDKTVQVKSKKMLEQSTFPYDSPVRC